MHARNASLCSINIVRFILFFSFLFPLLMCDDVYKVMIKPGLKSLWKHLRATQLAGKDAL